MYWLSKNVTTSIDLSKKLSWLIMGKRQKNHMWGIIPHNHLSSSHLTPLISEVYSQQSQQWKSPHLSTLLTKGSLSVQPVEHARAADSRTVAFTELSDPLNDRNTLLFSALCLNAVHTGPADIIPLWCLRSIRPVFLSLSRQWSLYLFHRTQQMESESTVTYRSLLMLSLPPMRPFTWALPLQRARPPHPDQTIPTEPANQAGARILLSALQPAPGQELAVTVKIYGSRAARGQSNTPTLPHSQEELLFKQ